MTGLQAVTYAAQGAALALCALAAWRTPSLRRGAATLALGAAVDVALLPLAERGGALYHGQQAAALAWSAAVAYAAGARRGHALALWALFVLAAAYRYPEPAGPVYAAAALAAVALGCVALGRTLVQRAALPGELVAAVLLVVEASAVAPYLGGRIGDAWELALAPRFVGWLAVAVVCSATLWPSLSSSGYRPRR